MIPAPTIFQEAWWLDICAGGNWHRSTFEHRYGTVAMTCAVRQRWFGLKEIYRPPLTPFLGVSWDNSVPDITMQQALTVISDAVPHLLENLPPHVRFKMNFHPGFLWWSPLFWEGYKETIRYTYRIEGIKDLDRVWSDFNSNAKRNIKKAIRCVTVSSEDSAEVLYDLFSRTMYNQGKRPGYPKRLLTELWREVKRRGKGEILIARDSANNPHSALLVVWHNDESYYLVGGTDPNLRNSGAMMLTMWTAIKRASLHSSVFDFEGSMQRGIDKFIRNFGALPSPYHQVTKFDISSSMAVFGK